MAQFFLVFYSILIRGLMWICRCWWRRTSCGAPPMFEPATTPLPSTPSMTMATFPPCGSNLAYTQNFLWFVITVFMLFIDMMLDEIEVLNFGHGGMYSIHCWNRFLYIIRAHFYILLEQLFVHFYTIIHCWSTLLCIVRTLWHKLLEQLSVHFYTIRYIVGTQFYTLFYALFGLGPSRFR